MRFLTEDATLICDHGGRVSIDATQGYVRIETKRVLVRPNPENRGIAGCPNSNPLVGILSCRTTLEVRQGYSQFVRIGGAPVCLDTVLGYTDGSPPRVANYKVVNPAQVFVGADQ
ncbi:MAG TPA: hypothetical protein VMU08_14170 [Rhizomicrobium sp.]|nr:hypothetical protein [Rhizomicrobium sp.]